MTMLFDRIIGIDEAKEKHDICIIDSEGKILIEKNDIEHSVSGIQSIISQISKFSDNNFDRVAVAIEKPHGAVVDTLMERGIHVYSLNPKQLDRFRDRYTSSGAKDDRLDAYVLADSLRTDLHCFHQVKLGDPLTVELKEISRLSDELTKEKVRLINQLKEQINRFAPHLFKLCPGIDSEWFLELLKIISSGIKIQKNRISRLLKQYHVRRVSVDEVINTIKSSPLTLASGTIEGIKFRIETLVEELQLIENKIKVCKKKIQILIKQIDLKEKEEKKDKKYSDVEIIQSMPGIGDIITSILLSEVPELLSNRNYAGLRLMSGIAPVTRRSGKKMSVKIRRSCNKRLRNALYHWARGSTEKDGKSLERYENLKKKGHSHSRSLRGLGDSLLRTLISMLKTNTLYDPNYKNNKVDNKDLQLAA
jgi:transposase